MNHVTCKRCLARVAESPKNEHGFAFAHKLFNVGNPAAGFNQHAQYHTHDGRVALCVADKLETTK